MAELHGTSCSAAASITSLADAMRAHLKTLVFPSSAAAYDLPDLELPTNNKHARSVKAAGLKQCPVSQNPEPDFLLSKLERKLASIQEYSWDPSEPPTQKPALLLFPPGEKSVSCLTGARGTGKTRYLLERCWDEFGLYIVGSPRCEIGSKDLARFLAQLPYNPGETTLQLEVMHKRLIDRMNRVILARTLVLEAAMAACAHKGSEFLPRHWLILQLFPDRFVTTAASGLVEVFKDTASTQG